MKENLRPFGYLDEYIDMLDVSAETKGEIREKLIDNIQKNNKIQLEQERLEGYMEGEKWAKLEYKRETAEKEDYVRMYVIEITFTAPTVPILWALSSACALSPLFHALSIKNT